ncbi:uncharacterized protein [Antedon mediterranea]|uniref:uncharacterized protein n=1 Tax=Antedon mediterranea TaxID=105859 RepID=UPI003AF807E8
MNHCCRQFGKHQAKQCEAKIKFLTGGDPKKLFDSQHRRRLSTALEFVSVIMKRFKNEEGRQPEEQVPITLKVLTALRNDIINYNLNLATKKVQEAVRKKKPAKYFHWRAGQINVNTCSDDFLLHETLIQIKAANLDIVCMQEVRRIGTGAISHEGYNVYWTGLKIKKMYGVAIAIKQSPHIKVSNVYYVYERLMAIDVTIQNCKLRIVSAYSPTESGSESSKDIFYAKLSKVTRVENNTKLLLMGDFNATSTITTRKSLFDGNLHRFQDTDDISNDNGTRLINYCSDFKLCILNTWFDHPNVHRITWHSNDGVTKKILDYNICDHWLRKYVTDTRVYNNYYLSSDHRILVSNMTTPANKAARWKKHKKKKQSKRANMSKLKDREVRNNVKTKIEEEINKITSPEKTTTTTSTERYTTLMTVLNKAVEEVPKKTRNQNAHPWDGDERLQQLIKERKNINKSIVTYKEEEIKAMQKAIKIRVKELRNEYLYEEASKLNEAHQNRKIFDLWRKAKEHGDVIRKAPKPIKCPGLREHFKDHFNPDQSSLKIPDEISTPPEYIINLRQPEFEMDNEPPSKKEIIDAIGHLKGRKATLDVASEMLQVATENPVFVDHVHRLFEEIWRTKEVPSDWGLSKLTTIWKKKGSPLDPSMYRGISIGSTFSKILMVIILSRFSIFYESQLLRTQFGFRSNRGCNDAIYVIKQIQEIAYRSNRKLYTCFIDLTAAFDHVNRNLLFLSVRNRFHLNQSTTMIDIIQSLYSSTKAYLADDDPSDDKFETSSGVRQGGIESTSMFNQYFDYVIRVFKQRCKDASLDGLMIQYLIPIEATNRAQRCKAPSRGIYDDFESGYADDFAVSSWSQEELQTIVNILNKVCLEFGLRISAPKTETIIWNWKEEVEEYPRCIIQIGGVHINNVTHFRYLGVWATYNDVHIGDQEVKYRINSAKGAFAENRALLTNRTIHLQTRMMFLNGLVRSRLTYGCHAWRATGSEMSKLSTTYKTFLRRMLVNGFQRVCPPNHVDISSDEETDENYIDWRYVIDNDDLYKITGCQPLEEYVYKQQFNWIGHMR